MTRHRPNKSVDLERQARTRDSERDFEQLMIQRREALVTGALPPASSQNYYDADQDSLNDDYHVSPPSGVIQNANQQRIQQSLSGYSPYGAAQNDRVTSFNYPGYDEDYDTQLQQPVESFDYRQRAAKVAPTGGLNFRNSGSVTGGVGAAGGADSNRTVMTFNRVPEGTGITRRFERDESKYPCCCRTRGRRIVTGLVLLIVIIGILLILLVPRTPDIQLLSLTVGGAKTFSYIVNPGVGFTFPVTLTYSLKNTNLFPINMPKNLVFISWVLPSGGNPDIQVGSNGDGTAGLNSQNSNGINAGSTASFELANIMVSYNTSGGANSDDLIANFIKSCGLKDPGSKSPIQLIVSFTPSIQLAGIMYTLPMVNRATTLDCPVTNADVDATFKTKVGI